MLYKRPSLRRGGTPTGIETLEPRVQAQKGLFVRDEITNELRPSKGIFSSDFNKQVFNADGTPIKFELKKPSDFADDALLLFGPGKFLKAGGAGLNILKQAGKFGTKPDFYGTTTGVLSKNLEKAPLFSNQRIREVIRPYTSGIMETTKAAGRGTKDFFKNYGIAAGTGGGLGTAAFFGLGDYLEDEPGKSGELPGEDDPTLDEGDSLSGQDIDINRIINNVVKDNKQTTSKDTGTGGEIEEFSFDDEFQKQTKRLEKYLGSTNRETKGRIALALSEAVGTPGSLADKASVLNKSLLNIAAGKKKDRADLAKLAFAATNELEKASIVAGKKTFTERQVEDYRKLMNKSNKTAQDLKDIKILEGVLGIKDTSNLSKATLTQLSAITKNIRDNQKSINTTKIALENTKKPEEKKLLQDKIKKLEKDIEADKLLLDEFKISSDLISRLLNEKKDGGRIELAESFPGTVGEAAETNIEAPASPVDTSLNFEELRTRLPKEITDDIVRLISTSEEALQDFAYIRTQGDINKFNIKYGVNLILPPDAG